MKIISGFKDSYDYLQSLYGVDEKLVLDRRKYYNLKYIPKGTSKVVIHIGEYLLEGLVKNETFYWGADIEQFSSPKTKYDIHKDYKDLKNDFYIVNNELYRGYENIKIFKEPVHLGDKSPTWKEDCPILIKNYSDYTKHPILKQYNINSFVTNEWIWHNLTEWLSKRITKNEPDVPIGTDKERILSAGFDLKTSFRNKIK
jgi:hypothetical protein